MKSIEQIRKERAAKNAKAPMFSFTWYWQQDKDGYVSESVVQSSAYKDKNADLAHRRKLKLTELKDKLHKLFGFEVKPGMRFKYTDCLAGRHTVEVVEYGYPQYATTPDVRVKLVELGERVREENGKLMTVSDTIEMIDGCLSITTFRDKKKEYNIEWVKV